MNKLELAKHSKTLVWIIIVNPSLPLQFWIKFLVESMPLIQTTPPLHYAISTFTTLTNAPSSSSSSSTLSVPTFASNFLPKFHYPKPFRFTTTKNRSRAAVIRAEAGTDYYSILNVSSNATLKEIKASYRKLARKVPTLYCVCVLILLGCVWFWGKWSKLG